MNRSTSRTRHVRLPVLVLVALAVSGCGGASDADLPGRAVALQAAEVGPTPDDDPGPAPDSAVAGAPAALRACLTRNDAVVPWRENADHPAMRRWHGQHRQQAHERVIGAVEKRLEIEEGSRTPMTESGFLGYDLDPVNSRLIMQLDPDVLDVAEFTRWVRAVARRANVTEHVRGTRLTVTVQEGCFSARKIERLFVTLRKDGHVTGWFGDVRLDGRIHAVFCGKADLAHAAKLQRRVGPILAIGEMCTSAA